MHKPGRPLDKLIATEVFHLVECKQSHDFTYPCYGEPGEDDGKLLPNYSTSNTDAQLVIDALKLDWLITIQYVRRAVLVTMVGGKHQQKRNIQKEAYSMPHAICAAALDAVAPYGF